MIYREDQIVWIMEEKNKWVKAEVIDVHSDMFGRIKYTTVLWDGTAIIEAIPAKYVLPRYETILT